MIVALLLQALSLGAPAWLSSPEPGVRQRWSSVELRDAATGTTGAAVVLSSAHAAHFGITGSALLRIETTSTSTGCQPKAVRRLTNFGASAELPLPPSSIGGCPPAPHPRTDRSVRTRRDDRATHRSSPGAPACLSRALDPRLPAGDRARSLWKDGDLPPTSPGF